MDKLNNLYQEWKSLFPISDRKRYLLGRRFSVDYNFNSNHIEGNTLTYGQTELLLMFGKVSGESDLKDYVDMKASEVGMEMMVEESKLREQPLTQNFIRQLHKTLLREDYTVYRNLPGGVTTSYVIHAGRYKTRPNSVITRHGERFEYASPEETPALMSDLVEWYNKEASAGNYSPVELAALFHYRYIRIHPFEDGNGRIARLLANYILARHDWPMIVIRSRSKQDYLEALHQSDVEVGDTPHDGAHATLSQIRKFLRFFKAIVAEELKYNIGFLEDTSGKAWWYDGQRVTFRSNSTPLLLAAIRDNPDITIEELSRKASISVGAVNKQLGQLSRHGYIQRSEKDGGWHVFASQSI